MGGVLGTGREAQLMLAARTGDTRRCNALISRSTPVNCSNQWGSTPLHHAAWQGHIETVWFLLQAGANPSARNQEGFTACDYAVKHGHGDIVTLLSKGPQYSQYSVPFVPPPNGTACVEEWQEDDEWQADDDGEWGDDYLENDIDSRLGVEQWRDSESFGQGPIVDDREAHMLVAAWNGRLADCQMFLRQGVNVHARSEDGQTCLHFAAYQGHLGVLELFLRAGADPDVQSEVYPALLQRSVASSTFLDSLRCHARRDNVHCIWPAGRVIHTSSTHCCHSKQTAIRRTSGF
eukprot:m.185844 g.185844  ORF g.185844 m.185844 type:complete len:291 (+) comp53549_c0_seq8:95-967(+)